MIGETLGGRYQITERIGSGAMGIVYRAFDLQSSSDVAVKALPPALAQEPKYLARFEREAIALRNLNHPSIVPFIDSFQEGENFYLVMEYMPGGSLYNLLQKEGVLDVDRARQIAIDISDALIRAHRLDIIHRDLKPENILFDAEGNPRLADFGVAGLTVSDEGTRLTGTGALMGTPYYMSPEAWHGEQVDEQTDVWSLGIVLYEMLSGAPPFQGKTAIAVMREILQKPTPDIRQTRQDVPQGIYQIIRKALAKDKTQRYASVRAFSADLAAGRPSTPLTEVVAIPGRRPSLTFSFSIIITVIAAVVISVFVLTRRDDKSTLEITRTSTEFASQQNGAAIPTHTPSVPPTDTPSATHTVIPSATFTATAILTLTPSPTQISTLTPPPTQTSTLTDTPTVTYTASSSPTSTLSQVEVEATVEFEIAWRLTQTAVVWTDTPTNTSTLTPSPTPSSEPTEVAGVGIPPGAPVTSNSQWTPFVKEFDGFSMALVPAGCFTMGSTEQEVDYALQLCEQQRGPGACQRDWYQDESPPGQICIHTPYWIDRYEVTNGDFGSTGYWLGNSRPREMVNWFEAVQFCESRSYGRLPTEAEWEFAARGPDHLVFPWGNTLISGNAIHGRSSGPTENIGSLPANMSWVGAFDMVGNVWEWVHTVYDETRFPYPYQINDGRENTLDSPRYVLRGGSWLDSAGDIRTANRDGADAAAHWQGFGFRCIRDFRAVDLTP